jgi:hypothetical protein
MRSFVVALPLPLFFDGAGVAFRSLLAEGMVWVAKIVFEGVVWCV